MNEFSSRDNPLFIFPPLVCLPIIIVNNDGPLLPMTQTVQYNLSRVNQYHIIKL